MTEPMPTPTCIECGMIVWPGEPAQVSIRYAGDETDDPPDPDKVVGGIVHGRCVEALQARLSQSE